jgi:hypothetical protein
VHFAAFARNKNQVEAAVLVPIYRQGEGRGDIDGLEGVRGPGEFRDTVILLSPEEAHASIWHSHNQVEVAVLVPIYRLGSDDQGGAS